MKIGGEVSIDLEEAVPARPPPPVRALSSESAGTLVEAIVATAIVIVACAGIIGSINYGSVIMQLDRENTRATQILLERLESARLYNWSEVTSLGYVPVTFTEYYDPDREGNSRGAVYNGTLSVRNADFRDTMPSYSTNLRQLTVTVSWSTGGKLSHTQSLSTYIAKNGVQNYVY